MKPPDPVAVLRGHHAEVNCVQFLEGSSTLMSGDADGHVILWDCHRLRPISSQKVHSPSAGVIGLASISMMSSVSSSPAADMILTQGRDGLVKAWQHSGSHLSRSPFLCLQTGSFNFCRFAIAIEPQQSLPLSASHRLQPSGERSLLETEGGGGGISSQLGMNKVGSKGEDEMEGEGKDAKYEGEGKDAKYEGEERVSCGRGEESWGVLAGGGLSAALSGLTMAVNGEGERSSGDGEQRDGGGCGMHESEIEGGREGEQREAEAERGVDGGMVRRDGEEEDEDGMFDRSIASLSRFAKRLNDTIEDGMSESRDGLEMTSRRQHEREASPLIAMASEHSSMVEVWDLRSSSRAVLVGSEEGFATAEVVGREEEGGGGEEKGKRERKSGSKRAAGMAMSLRLLSNQELPGGICLAVGFEDGRLAGWDLRRPLLPLMSAQICSSPVMAMDLDSKSQGLAGSADASLVFFRMDWGQASIADVSSLELSRPGVAAAAIRSDDRLAATAGWDGRIRIFDMKRRKPLAILKHHSKGATSVAFSSDNSLLVSASRDASVALWSIYPSKNEHSF